MAKIKTYMAANLKIRCDERCPIYYCDDPCRVKRHAETYVKLIEGGHSCAQMSGE